MKLSETFGRFVLNAYPPFVLNRIRITSIAEGYRACRVKIKRSFLNRNMNGTTFGGALFSAADPFYAILYWQIFERKGYKLVGLNMTQPGQARFEEHYGEHKERPFFAPLVAFASSGPVVAMVWEGHNVIKSGRKMIGATNPDASEPGTIRGDLAINFRKNIIHASDSVESAQKEIDLWFGGKD